MPSSDGHQSLDWPEWIPAAFGLIGLATGVAVILQRANAEWEPGLVIPVAAVAFVLLPYVLETVAYFTAKPFLAPPRWAYPVCVLVGTAILVANPTPVDFSPFFLVFVSAQMAAETERWPGLTVALGGIALMVAVDAVQVWDAGSFIWTVGIALGWLGGFSVHFTAKQASDLRRINEELEAAQSTLAEKAAADERSRIAREVHDVIAHSLSVTMLHVTAARMALQKGSDEPALESLQEAEKQGRKSLAEIRRTVGLLGPDADATAPPMPGTGDLPNLIEEFRTAGLDVTLRMNGDVLTLPPAAGLSLYRIVQESLTNAAKHAPGARASVELTLTADDIRLRIHNARSNGAAVASDGGGLGIRGMIERASVLDGHLAAGPDDEGWTVFLHAPRPVDQTA